MTDGLIQIEQSTLRDFLEVSEWLVCGLLGRLISYGTNFLCLHDKEYLAAEKDFNRLHSKLSQALQDHQEATADDP